MNGENMDDKTIGKIFMPVLADGMARLNRRRGNVDNRDVQVIFAPIIESITLAAGGGSAVASARLVSWAPADVTPEAVATLVQDIVTAATPAFDMADMRRRQAELEAEMSAIVRPDRPAISYQ
jgi:hypothetical protein